VVGSQASTGFGLLGAWVEVLGVAEVGVAATTSFGTPRARRRCAAEGGVALLAAGAGASTAGATATDGTAFGGVPATRKVVAA
jgi:hypothetical protein